MHNKFAVLDQGVVLTGSFNWTTQAAKFNQENILFFENQEMAKKYHNEFEKLWEEFKTNLIDREEAKEYVQEEKESKKKFYANK